MCDAYEVESKKNEIDLEAAIEVAENSGGVISFFLGLVSMSVLLTEGGKSIDDILCLDFDAAAINIISHLALGNLAWYWMPHKRMRKRFFVVNAVLSILLMGGWQFICLQVYRVVAEILK